MSPRHLRYFLTGILFATLGLSEAARAGSELVVAIRYLQAEGKSRSHLYLYQEDGTFMRQLTTDNSGQDRDPIFAPDGRSIIFARDHAEGPVEYWSVKAAGGKPRLLESPPDWYPATKDANHFLLGWDHQGTDSIADERYQTPDGQFELVLVVPDGSQEMFGPGHGSHYQLKELDSGKVTEFGAIPGFLGADSLMPLRDNLDQRFLWTKPLQVAFFTIHLGSTDGTTVHALDFVGRRFVSLSENSAAPIPLPGQAAFLSLAEHRYQEIPGGRQTANCLYLERWDERLNKIRYAKPGSAAICYGFSMHRPGLEPAVISMRKEE